MVVGQENPPNFAPPPSADGAGAPPPRQSRARHSRRSRLWVFPWLAALIALVTGAAGLLPIGPVYPLVVLLMMLPWVAVAAILSSVAAVFGRQGLLLLFALAGAALASWPVAEERWPQQTTAPDPQGVPLRVLTANLYVANTDHRETITSLLEANADVLCLEEVTHGWAVSLDIEEVTSAYPYRQVHPEDTAFGIALLSRVPVTKVDLYRVADLPQLRAIVDVEGSAVEIHCIHLMPPLTPELYAVHRQGGDELLEMLEARPASSGPVILAGDFNSSPYNALHGELTAHLEDAWLTGDTGFGHSAPANPSLIPPMRIDHVYVGAGVRSMGGELLPPGDSDHYPLAIDLTIPRQGPDSSSMDEP